MHKLYNQDAIDFGPWETSNQNNLNTFYYQNILQQEDGVDQTSDQDNNEIQLKIELSKNDNPPDDHFRIKNKTLVKNYSEPNIHNRISSVLSSLQSTPKHIQQNQYDSAKLTSHLFTKNNHTFNEKKRSNSLKKVENISDLKYNKIIKNDFNKEKSFDLKNHQQTQVNKSKSKIKLETDKCDNSTTMNFKNQDAAKIFKQNISILPKKYEHQRSQTETNQNNIEDLINSQKQRQSNSSFKQKQEFNRYLIQYGQQTLQTSNFLDNNNVKEFQKNFKNKIQSVRSPLPVNQSITDSINNALNQLKSFSSKSSYLDKTFKKPDELFQQQDWKQKIQQKNLIEQNSSFFSANKESQKQSNHLSKEEKNNQILQMLDEQDSQNQNKKPSIKDQQSSPSSQQNSLLSLKKRPSINTNVQLKKLSFNIPVCQDLIYQQVEQQMQGMNFNTPKNNSNQIENSIYYQYIQQKIINKGIKGQKVRNFFASQRNLLRSCPNPIETNQNQNEQTQNFKANAKGINESKTSKQISNYLNDGMIFLKSEVSSPTQLLQNQQNSEILQKLNEKQNYLMLRRSEQDQNKSEQSQINQYLNLPETSNRLSIDQNLNQSLIKVSLLKYNLNSIGGRKFKFKDLSTLPS
ncbi:hypothetical protein ABPG74_014864 [Tetrahymena malaccensis]